MRLEGWEHLKADRIKWLHQSGATTQRSKPKLKIDTGADISVVKSKFLDTLVMSMLYALMALCLFGSTLAQVITSGGCPDAQVQENFNISRNMGRWYEQERFYTLFEVGTRCGVFDYTAGPDNSNTTTVVYTGRSVLTGLKRIFQSEVTMPDPQQPAKLSVKIPMSPVKGDDNLWVLGSDYENWGAFFSCTVIGSTNVQYAWIGTRAQLPDDSVLASARAVLLKNKIDTSRLTKTDQKRCPK